MFYTIIIKITVSLTFINFWQYRQLKKNFNYRKNIEYVIDWNAWKSTAIKILNHVVPRNNFTHSSMFYKCIF